MELKFIKIIDYCAADVEKINKLYPAFLNRFDIIALEEQLEEIDNYNNKGLKDLLRILFQNSFSQIESKNEKIITKLKKRKGIQIIMMRESLMMRKKIKKIMKEIKIIVMMEFLMMKKKKIKVIRI